MVPELGQIALILALFIALLLGVRASRTYPQKLWISVCKIP